MVLVNVSFLRGGLLAKPELMRLLIKAKQELNWEKLPRTSDTVPVDGQILKK